LTLSAEGKEYHLRGSALGIPGNGALDCFLANKRVGLSSGKPIRRRYLKERQGYQLGTEFFGGPT